MSLDQTQNFVRATIASAVDSADTTIDVTDSNQLPDPADGAYNLILWDVSTFPRPGQDPAVEVVRATALDESADALTVDRAQENTTAADHPETAVLQLSPTAKMFADIDSKTSALSDDGQTFAGESVDVDALETSFKTTVGDDETIQDAVDRADNVGKGVVEVPPGEYEESVDVGRGIRLEAAHSGTSTGNGGVLIDARGLSESPPAVDVGEESIIHGINLRGDEDDIVLSGNDAIVCNARCRTADALLSGDFCRFYANRMDGDDIVITGDNNRVFGNTDIGTIDNQGSGNEVFGN